MIKIWRSEIGKAMLGVLGIFAAIGVIFFFSSFATDSAIGHGMQNVGLRLYYDSSTGQFRPIGAGWPADVNIADVNLIVLGIIVSGDITANNLEVNNIDANDINVAGSVTLTGGSGFVNASQTGTFGLIVIGSANEQIGEIGDVNQLDFSLDGIIQVYSQLRLFDGLVSKDIIYIAKEGSQTYAIDSNSLDEVWRDDLFIQSGDSGKDFILSLYSQDNDGTDDVLVHIHQENPGLPTWARLGWDASEDSYVFIGDSSFGGVDKDCIFDFHGSNNQLVLGKFGNISMAHSLGVGGDIIVSLADANVSVDEIYINEIHNPDDPDLYWLWVPASSGSGSGGWRFTREKAGVDPVLFNIYEMTVDQPANPFREFQQAHFNAHNGEFLFVIEGNAAFPTNYPHFFIVDANKNQVGIDMWPEDIRSILDINDGTFHGGTVLVDANVGSTTAPDRSIDFSRAGQINVLSGGRRLTTYVTGETGKIDWSVRHNTDMSELVNWWVFGGGQQMLNVNAGLNIFDIGDGTNFTRFGGDGDLFFAGTAGLIYGHMDIPAAAVVTVDTSATGNPVEVKDDGTASANDGWTSSYQNGVTFAVSNLHYQTVTFAGTYEVIWDMSPATAAGAGTLIHGGITIDSTTFQRGNGEGHAHVFNANDNIQINGVGTVDCPNGNEEISLWITNDQNQKTIIEHGNMRIQLIGGT